MLFDDVMLFVYRNFSTNCYVFFFYVGSSHVLLFIVTLLSVLGKTSGDTPFRIG